VSDEVESSTATDLAVKPHGSTDAAVIPETRKILQPGGPTMGSTSKRERILYLNGPDQGAGSFGAQDQFLLAPVR